MNIAIQTESVPLRADDENVFRVGLTRVTLDTVIAAFRNGATAETIVDQYPVLQLGEVYTVIGYYLRHQVEFDAYLLKRQEQAAQIRRENEARFNPIGVRERLLARRLPAK